MTQMPLSKFGKEYGFSRTTMWRMVNRGDFPAYKLGGQWYVDIPAYEAWREKEHRRQYKYAK